jgi:hypothetical protein
VQLPLAIYLTRALLSKQGMSGSAELAGVVYGAVVSLCTAVVCNDMWYLGPDVITREAKKTLLGTYLPYAVIRKLHHVIIIEQLLTCELATLMSLDMQKRLLDRLHRSSGIKQE